jgi:hypothetical protein
VETVVSLVRDVPQGEDPTVHEVRVSAHQEAMAKKHWRCKSSSRDEKDEG